MKLSVFTVMTPDLSPVRLVDALIEYGYEGVEWRYKETPENVKNEPPSFWRNNLCTIDPAITDEELERFREATCRPGLSVVSVTPYLSVEDFEGIQRAMQVAKALGAGQIRVGVPGYDGTKNYNDLFSETKKQLHDIQELSQAYGVKALVETHHKKITPSASLTHRLIREFDPQCVGVIYDPGNMVHEGFENYRLGMELLGPYLSHVHVKNAAWIQDNHFSWKSEWSPVHKGIVDWRQVIWDLKAVGYEGFLGF
jgi:sugar phosphate isomerase/epimerase